MKKITYTKGAIVETPNKQDFKKGIVAFQMVYFKINFFGKIIETNHDTKIMKNGTQIVIGGCGYIPDGFVVA